MKFILSLLVLSSLLLSQTTPAKKDSLLNSTKEISKSNKELRSEIEELKKLRDSLQQKLRTEMRDLFFLRYGEEAGSKISMGQIWTGMTEEMMTDSWGKPDSITVNNQPWGKYSQWYYGEITYFFKDGQLFEWESPESTEIKK